MLPEAWHAGFTAGLVGALLVALIATRYPLDILFLGVLAALMLAGVLGPEQAFSGLSNSGFLAVAALYVVVAGVRQTGGVQWLVQNLLRRPSSRTGALVNMTLPVAGLSAFINNTPVVAMMIPAVSEWARRFSLHPSKLFMPLSYAAILGGTCTLIGTSTNLVVNGLLRERFGEGLGMFTITPIGIGVLGAGLLFMLTLGRRLLPEREAAGQQLDNPREYTVEMVVLDGPVAGRSIEDAGLRHLPSCFLVEVDRNGQLLPAVSPQERLEVGDRLIFAGSTSAVVDLRSIRGLAPASDTRFGASPSARNRQLVEVVVSDQSPMVGRSVRAGRFRSYYGAAVIAVARGSRRLPGKIGDIVLAPGDVLMLEAGPDFIRRTRFSRDFLLTRRIEGSEPVRHERFVLAGGILVAVVVAAAVGLLPIFQAALCGALAMVATGCLSASSARASMEWNVLIVIAAAFGIGEALTATGVAATVGHALFAVGTGGPWSALILGYLFTAVVSQIITNNAAAVLAFPVVMSVADTAGVAPLALALVVMFGASASFATPIGYQTNMMVMGAGGYRFSDYLWLGLPMTLVTGVVAVLVIGLFYA